MDTHRCHANLTWKVEIETAQDRHQFTNNPISEFEILWQTYQTDDDPTVYHVYCQTAHMVKVGNLHHTMVVPVI